MLGANDYDRAPANMKATLTNMINSDKQLRIEQVTTPTVLLWGEADKTTPLHQGQLLARRLLRAVMKTYPEWAHAPYLTHPAALARAIQGALKVDPAKIPVRADRSELAAAGATATGATKTKRDAGAAPGGKK